MTIRGDIDDAIKRIKFHVVNDKGTCVETGPLAPADRDKLVDAVLDKLQEPTEEMLIAGDAAMKHLPTKGPARRGTLEIGFATMIRQLMRHE